MRLKPVHIPVHLDDPEGEWNPYLEAKSLINWILADALAAEGLLSDACAFYLYVLVLYILNTYQKVEYMSDLNFKHGPSHIKRVMYLILNAAVLCWSHAS